MTITISDAIMQRHTTKTAKMNGRAVDHSQINHLLELADRAPTHARTEPWRFFVYTGEGFAQFAEEHAEMYWEHTAEDVRMESRRQGLVDIAQHAGALIIVAMRRTPGAKIPMLEEYAATSAAIQNMLLGATAMDISAIWSTGGMAHKPAMKQYLGLAEEDEVVAMLYLGHTAEEAVTTERKISLEDKTQWHS